MKRVVRFAVVALAMVALTSCVDVVQYISGDGTIIDVYLRLTLQKSAFELANSFADEPQDMTEMFEDDFELTEEEVTAEFPAGIEPEYTQVNSEYEYGFELRYSADRSVLSQAPESSAGFIPTVTTRGIRIPFAQAEAQEGGEAGGGDGDEFANAFLGGSKYRLMISKRLVSRVSDARIVNSEGDRDVLVTELPDVWMVEFPTSLWLNAEQGTYLDVRF